MISSDKKGSTFLLNSWTWILYILYYLPSHPPNKAFVISNNHKLYNSTRLILNFLCLLGLGDRGNWESTRVKSRLIWKQIWPITICFARILPPCKRPLKGTQSADAHAHYIPILSCFAHHKMRVKQRVRSASGISIQILWSWTNCKSKS